ncbi:MAG: DUF1361 domain-containing protein [Firmicutes bacterium]|nr:DUF1361 domain-containing protein [Bacillota bacterium]
MTDFMKTIQFKVTFFVGIYIVISFPIALYLRNFLHIFMGWNLILALVPLYASYLFRALESKKSQTKKQPILLVLIFFVWLFFLPNTFYVITDLIHLGSRDFYFQSSFYMPWDYIEDIKNYLALTHIFVGAIISLTAGVISLSDMQQFVRGKYNQSLSIFFVLVVLFLSSIAIYIGRFLRFNSWDILHPLHLLETLFNRVDLFFIQFVFLFWLVQIIVYFYFRALFKNRVGVKIE